MIRKMLPPPKTFKELYPDIDRYKDIRYDDKEGFPHLPYNILCPPGSNLDLVTESMINSMAVIYNPTLACLFTLAMLDHVKGGAYKEPSCSTTSPLHTICTGDSSKGKTQAVGAAFWHLKEAGCEDKLHNIVTSTGSGQGMEDRILSAGDGADLLYIADEFGLGTKGKDEGHVAAFTKIALDMKTQQRAAPLIKRALASEGRIAVEAPHVTMFQTATNESLVGVFSKSDSATGLLPRNLIQPSIGDFFGPKARFGLSSEPEPPDKKAVKLMTDIYDMSKKVLGKDRSDYSKLIPVRLDIGAISYHEFLVDEAIMDEDVGRNKKAETIMCLAALIAVVNDPKKPVIRFAELYWADVLIECSIQYTEWLLDRLEVKGSLTNYQIESIILKQLVKLQIHQESNKKYQCLKMKDLTNRCAWSRRGVATADTKRIMDDIQDQGYFKINLIGNNKKELELDSALIKGINVDDLS